MGSGFRPNLSPFFSLMQVMCNQCNTCNSEKEAPFKLVNKCTEPVRLLLVYVLDIHSFVLNRICQEFALPMQHWRGKKVNESQSKMGNASSSMCEVRVSVSRRAPFLRRFTRCYACMPHTPLARALARRSLSVLTPGAIDSLHQSDCHAPARARPVAMGRGDVGRSVEREG